MLPENILKQSASDKIEFDYFEICISNIFKIRKSETPEYIPDRYIKTKN